jgi:hypothetical protein
MPHCEPTTAAPPRGDADHDEPVLVYHRGEFPAWREADELGQQQVPAPASPTGAEYTPIASLLHATPPETLIEARRRVGRLDRADLIQRYRVAHAGGKRLVAYVMAGELIKRGTPPCFWHEALALEGATLAQRADLMLADLAWLRRWHPKHISAVRYQCYKGLLTGSETVFHREAAFLFCEGKRPAWKIVGTLSMNERQQWDAAYLRSTPIKREAEATAILSARVWQALHHDLQMTRRTATFSDADAGATRDRRYAIWHCARMVKNGSPTEIAARYTQMTGSPITRQAAAKQLEKVQGVLRAKGDDFMT